MNDVPTLAQIDLLLVAVALFAIGGVLSLSRALWQKPTSRLPAKMCAYHGILIAAIVLAWHSVSRGSWLPLQDNFDALIWLAILLASFVMYVQRRRPIAGLDWFVMPLVMLLLVAAVVFGRERPHEYVASTWSWVHRVTAYGGTVAFLAAGALGMMYLVVNHRLRNKTAPGGIRLANLERLEHATLVSVTLGFALLTIGLITGLAMVLHRGGGTLMGSNWITSPKVLLTFGVWVVYALVLHSPLNPSFRGRRAALLSILGLVLTIGTVVAVQYMPKGR